MEKFELVTPQGTYKADSIGWTD
jgi:hypothetical protein